jgi:hypothetical protein
MENSVCEFDTLNNPSRKHANTVNLVFFRAVPTTKSFQKYVDGLRSWKKMKHLFPNCQFQVFVDEYVSQSDEILKEIKALDARILLFKCPNYMKDSQFHIGLFPTMVRFYPMFDVNPNPLHIAHIQELEPTPDDAKFILPMIGKLTSKQIYSKFDIAVVYHCHLFEILGSPLPKINGVLEYPYMLAGRVSVTKKVPFELWTSYLEDIESGKQFFNSPYLHSKKPEHGKYSFGVDEIFLNQVYLKHLIEQGYGIGLCVRYRISDLFYYRQSEIKNNPRSKNLLDYILQESQSVSKSLKQIDSLFYTDSVSQSTAETANRFYEVVEKYPDWLGTELSKILLAGFSDKSYYECIVVVRDNKIQAVLAL